MVNCQHSDLGRGKQVKQNEMILVGMRAEDTGFGCAPGIMETSLAVPECNKTPHGGIEGTYFLTLSCTFL